MCSYKTLLGVTTYLCSERSLGWGFLIFFFIQFYKLCGKLGTVQNDASPEKFTEVQSPINMKFAEQLCVWSSN